MNNSFNIQSNRALIQREQTYVLDKKLLAVHSEDRDYTQFPNSNNFSLDIGEAMTNVQSVRLVSYAFPNNCFNISTSYQNTKMAYNYYRDFEFDTRSLLVKPTRSLDTVEAHSTGPGNGGGDYRLGAFQQVLEQVFPGIIKPYYSPTTGATTLPDGPDNNYFTAPATVTAATAFNNDWDVHNQRGMVYTSFLSAASPEPHPNFGRLGLSPNVDIYYEDTGGNWISIKDQLPYSNGSPPPPLPTEWHQNMLGWTSTAPVPEASWSGRFKIRFKVENKIITLPEGAYSPNDLAGSIMNKMNEQIMSYANSLGHQFINNDLIALNDRNLLMRMVRKTSPTANIEYTGPYTQGLSSWNILANSLPKSFQPIVCRYDGLTNNLLLACNQGHVELVANLEIKYDFEKEKCSPNKYMFGQYTKWGLPYYMGFNKEIYNSFDINIDGDIFLNDSSSTGNQPLDICGNAIQNVFLSNLGGLIFYSNSNDNWIEPFGVGEIIFYDMENPALPTTSTYGLGQSLNRTVSVLSSPNNVSLMGEDCIYMEMEKFNNTNEIYPFSERTNTMYNCDYGHNSDSAFAIIPLTQTPFGSELGNRTSINTNVFMSEPPIKNVNRLQFKFRYHDGRLVDFKNLPFSFVLEFNMIRDEQARNKIVRVPHLY